MAGTVYDNTIVRRTLSPAVVTNGTLNGAAVDRAANGGAEEAIAVVLAGAVTDGSHAVTVQDSDDGTTAWTQVPAGQLQGAQPTITSANSNQIFEVGVGASRRFLRVVIVTSAATTGGLLSACIVLGDSRFSPASHA